MTTLYYSNSACPEVVPHPSIFLAGPTPRRIEDLSWRPAAIELLKDSDVSLYLPEWDTGQPQREYEDQIRWEWKHLDACTVLLFWVPRKSPEFPGFTTNVEFGHYLAKRPDRVIYGRPPGAEKTKYLDDLYRMVTGREPHDTLEATCRTAGDLAQNV
jgi:hypothetical protein